MRLPAFAAALLVSLTFAGGAFAYPWPVRPFHQAHPVRANFGDPRTVFETSLFQDGVELGGAFTFHNGIDISAPDGTNVFPVVSGTVKSVRGFTVTVRSDDDIRVFQYVHIIPVVIPGEHVVALKTALGYIAATYGHVHLDELRSGRVWNPLAKGGIAPYQDFTTPTVRSIYIRRWNSLEPVNPVSVCGHVSIAADAFDTQSLRVPGEFSGFPVSPALLKWSLTERGSTRRLAAVSGSVDFRATLPPAADFWKIYARGTYQNGPRFGRRQFPMPGLFMYQLTHQGLDTRSLTNGVYKITVTAQDIKGNSSRLTREFRVVNDPSTTTGCRPAAHNNPQPPAPPSP